jgi:spore maturation protein A
MNAIFGIIITVCTVILIFTSPESLLSTMLEGGNKALNLTLKMVVIYAVWMGVFKIMEKTGLSQKIAKLSKPINRFLFGNLDQESDEYISLNLSANLLGMSGATTPMGISAIRSLDKSDKTDYAVAMFFVINATSVQLIPSSILALRATFNSASPSDIILPTILATLVSTIVGILLVKIFIKRDKL